MSILIFIAVLVVLILVHEFGHFIVAKRSGIRVDEFGIGFPPKIWGKRYGETEYTLNWLPLGGFVKIWGEDPTEEHVGEGPDIERSFVKKPKLVQAAVLVAGVTMNVLLAYVLFVSAYLIGTPTAVEEGQPYGDVQNVHLTITSTLPESPAAAVLEPGDEIISVARADASLTGSAAQSPEHIAAFVSKVANEPVTVEIRRAGEVHTLSLTPVAGLIADEPDHVLAGFTMSLIGTERLPFTRAVVEGAKRTWYGLSDVAVGLWTLLTQAVQGKADMSAVTGPVGIVGLVGDAARLGFVWLLTFTAFISLNLAVINLLPIPALDGGRLVFVIIEAITRKPIKPSVATRVNQVGFAALLLLMAVVTVHDIVKLF